MRKEANSFSFLRRNKMRYINLEEWSHREHFNLYKTFDHPHFGMCANVDLTAFHPVLKQRGYSLTIALVYLITRSANAIPEFRYRIQSEEVIEYAIVSPSFTILTNEETFSFCTVNYMKDFSVFAERAAEEIAKLKKNPRLDTVSERDDMLYMTPIPWVSFTSFMHPMKLNPADSIPRFAWGKIFEENGFLKMPLSVQGHHAVMDGLHIGRFYETIQNLLNHPEDSLGKI